MKTMPTEQQREPRCVQTARSGLRTGNDVNTFLSLLISDLAEGAMTPMAGNAICNATGKLLKNVEMHLKYGNRGMTAKGMKMATLPGDSVDKPNAEAPQTSRHIEGNLHLDAPLMQTTGD